MEPLNDKELNELLRRWEAPGAPASLMEKFLPRPERLPWWRWLWSGSIRVPVPIGLAVIAILLSSVFVVVNHRRTTVRKPGEVTLSDFQPVKQLQPRITRSRYEGN